MATVKVTWSRLAGIDLKLATEMLTAVAVPAIILLFSGISIFSSASSRGCKARILLIILTFCPLGLCLAGNDFGRWYSVNALNFAVYALLIAHPAGRTAMPCCFHSAADLKIKEAVRQCAVLAVTVILLNFRFDCWGQFVKSEQKFTGSLSLSVTNASRLAEDLMPVVYREIIVPHSDYASFPLRSAMTPQMMPERLAGASCTKQLHELPGGRTDAIPAEMDSAVTPQSRSSRDFSAGRHRCP